MLCPALLYSDAKAAVQQLTSGFGFTEVAVFEDDAGVVQHAELKFGVDGWVMLGTKSSGTDFAKAMREASPAGIYVTVEDVDAHHERAKSHGVDILRPPSDQDYGSRNYMARDLDGNVWSFGTYQPGSGS